MLPDVSEAEVDGESLVSLEGGHKVFLRTDAMVLIYCLDTLKHSLSSLISLLPPISTQIVSILSRRGYDALLPMRSIPAQFRAMSSKRMPTEPSHFVSSIFRALRTFFGIGSTDGPGAAVKGEFLQAYAEEVFENVSQRYVFCIDCINHFYAKHNL